MVQELHCKEVSFNWLFYSIIFLIFVDIFFILTIILSKIQHKESHSNLFSKTLHSTYEERKPDDGLIFHSDNGSNYTSKSFMKYLKELNITQSFSRPHIPYHNSVVESFFKYLKAEELYRTKYKSEREFK